MSTSSEIKQRANALAEKTDVNSITPKEVGSIMYDLASHSENVLRNGGTLGIRKVYESVAAMEADSTNPIDIWGNPIKKGNLVVIFDGTTTGVDNNKIYAFMNPGWQIATHLDAGYATKAETDAKLAELGSEINNYELNKVIDRYGKTVDVEGWGYCKDYILYDGGNIEWHYSNGGRNSTACIVLYDSSKRVVEFWNAATNDLGYVVINQSLVPSSCKYIRFSFDESYIDDAFVETISGVYSLKSLTLTNKRISKMEDIFARKDDLDKLENELNRLGSEVSNYELGKVLDRYGNEVDLIGWGYCSDYIPYMQGSIEWRYSSSEKNSTACIVLYDENKNVVDFFNAATNDLGYSVIPSSSIVSTCKFIRFSFDETYINAASVKINDELYSLKSLILTNERVSKIEEMIDDTARKEDLTDVKNELNRLSEQTFINESIVPNKTNHGLILNPSSIYNNGVQSYPYFYGVFNVLPNKKYKVTGFSVNPEYVCARAGVSNSDDTQILLTGANKQYIDEEITIPNGYDLLLVNSNDEIGTPLVKELKGVGDTVLENVERIEQIEKNQTLTDSLLEKDSNISQDSINLYSETQRKLNVSNRSTTIVCLVYDDVYAQWFVDLCNERGLKATFATIANIEKSSWDSVGTKLRKAQMDGHGTAAHGVVNGISVTGSGINTMNDEDNKKALEGENKAFDEFKLSHRGLVYFNTWVDRPHTWAIVKRYYDYAIGFGNAINTPGTTPLYALGRFDTDGSGMLESARNTVDAAIQRGNCVVMFGGHLFWSGQGGAHSTMDEFVAFLDYLKEKIDAGLLVSMNTDDAIDVAWGRCSFIAKHNYAYEDPCVGMLAVDGNTIKHCVNQGKRAVFRMTISGTPIVGSFTLTLANMERTSVFENPQNLNIGITESENTIEKVVDAIVAKIYYGFTVVKESSDTILLYRDIVGNVPKPVVSDNTSGLTIDITTVNEGVMYEFA